MPDCSSISDRKWRRFSERQFLGSNNKTDFGSPLGDGPLAGIMAPGREVGTDKDSQCSLHQCLFSHPRNQLEVATELSEQGNTGEPFIQQSSQPVTGFPRRKQSCEWRGSEVEPAGHGFEARGAERRGSQLWD